MEDNPRENILVQPEWSIIMFGNGYIAQANGGVEFTDSDGIRKVKFLIKPEPLLKKRYEITQNQLDVNGSMYYTFVKNDLIPLNIYDDANKSWLYLKTYDGKDCELTTFNKDLRLRLEQKDREIWTLQAEIIYLSEQLQIARTNPGEFAAQGLDLINKVIENATDLINAKKGRESE